MYNKVLRFTNSRLKTSQFGKLQISTFLLKSRTISTGNDTDHMIEAEIINNKGVLTLNKPDKLNCVGTAALKTILSTLIEWENKVEMVVIRGKGRAFCSGADIMLAVLDGGTHRQTTKDLLKLAYTINGVASQYPVPYVALIDGITMGTGVGLSVHGTARIATERTVLAMPETMIGSFTDNGSCSLFSKLPHHLGLFCALTGYRLKGTDVVKTGFATHYTKSDNIPTIFEGLMELKDPKNNLNEYLSKHTEDISDSELSLKPHFKVIETAFSAPTIEEIVRRLQSDGSDFASKTLSILKKMSPTAMKMSKTLIDMYKNKSLLEGLIYEHRFAMAVAEGKISDDLYEGVRALLVEKNKAPAWNPPSLKDVTDEMMESILKELPPEEGFNLTITTNEFRKKIQSTNRTL